MDKKEMENTQIFKRYLNPNKLQEIEEGKEGKEAFFNLIETIPRNLTEEAFNEAVADLIIEYTHMVMLKSTKGVYIYNYTTHRWESKGEIWLQRLVYEVTKSVDETNLWYRERNTCEHIKRKLCMLETFFDDYLVLTNGTFDRRTGEIIESQSNHYAHFFSTVVYDSEKKCARFLQFLNEVFYSDQSTIAFVQEWFGYILLSSHQANAFLIGYGSGANGKSLLFALLAKLVGECNTSSSGISAFQSRFGMEVMHNKLLNLATESDVNSFETATLKAVTAGEPITLNRKGIKEITCILPTKFIFLMNHLPLITDSSYGFSRRLLILPFPRTFRPEEQDPFLLEKMTLELSGILNFALEGAKRLIKNGYQFTISDLMNEAKEQFLGCVHPLSYFKAHYLSKNPTRKVESNLLFQTFQKMLKEKNWSARQYGTLRSFNKGLIELFEAEGFVISTKKSNGKTYLSGIVLNQSIQEL